MDENDLLEPRLLYQNRLKNEHHQNVCDYFEDLVKKSNIDIEANKKTIKEYNKALLEVKNASSYKGKKEALKGFLIFLIVVLFILCGVSIYCWIQNIAYAALSICGAIISPIIAILFIILVKNKINPAIKKLADIIKKNNEIAEQKKQEGYEQLAALNSLYDWNIQAELVTKTVPLLKMDKNFDPSKFEYLNQKFGFGENDDNTSSTIFVQSGSILGNPFLIEKAHVQTMGTYTYTGHLTISYTVRVPNGKGGYTTQTRTQTLTAHVTKPKPYYSYETWLTYGCEAAPKLKFTRTPSPANSMNEKQIEKYVHKIDKEIDKKAINNISSGFTPLGNEKFEALFKALDRDNEVEFRLLFTPLAQKNMLDTITSKEPYGDDFIFVKNKMLNHIKTDHAQSFDYEVDPTRFVHFDYEKAKEFFIAYNDGYFKSLFFDFVPLLNIPLYHQYPTDEYIFNKKYRTNVTSFESESLANKFNKALFTPLNCVTDIILKSRFNHTDGNADNVNIHSYGFKTIKHIDYVPTMGGDGRMHNVPVEWLEYVPVTKVTPMEIQPHSLSRTDYLHRVNLGHYNNFVEKNVSNGAIIFNRGLYSFLPKNDITYNSKDLDNLISDKENN